ncbi:MAG: glycosyltransferase family 2 protein [Bacteroidales bacterium]|jgi:glycosyltransferase involved in cell wall biosynthesis|nr:glycosyltransferase family 2 protein [Bacteroidales bacterium]
MNKISVIIIAYNEEKNIARCINSVAGIADEIIVVDSGSIDQTKEIVKNSGAKLIIQDFLGYAGQKNFGVNHSSYDYILSLDADEALSPKLKSELLKIKNSLSPDNVYEMNRKTNYCGKWISHGGWYPDWKIRLYNKNTAHWGGGSLHEKIIINKDISIKKINADIEHYSYYTIQDHINQIQKFTDISSKELYEKEKKAPLTKLLFSGHVKFLRDYIFRFGFLDGYAGFRIAKISAFATFLKYAKLKELNDLKNHHQ